MPAERSSRDIAVGLGSNLNNRLDNLRRALAEIKACGIEIKRCSSVWETEPWGVENQPKFLNMCAIIESSFGAYKILKAFKKIEKRMGRKKGQKWGPREIDLDILLIGREIINSPNLIVPHPYIEQRDFVLTPLAEIAPAMVHPLNGLTVAEMKRRVPKEKMSLIMRTI
jgi:2-amino-4-hydroxy-6-hydroxymethyldihydropteridine diphosphokinase